MERHLRFTSKKIEDSLHLCMNLLVPFITQKALIQVRKLRQSFEVLLSHVNFYRTLGGHKLDGLDHCLHLCYFISLFQKIKQLWKKVQPFDNVVHDILEAVVAERSIKIAFIENQIELKDCRGSYFCKEPFCQFFAKF